MKACSNESDAMLQAQKDEEIIGILNAISVVSKQLAVKLARLSQQKQLNMEGGRDYGQNERTCRCRF